MKHLRLFETEAQFNEAKDSFELPVVSLIKENNELGFFPKEKEDDMWVDLGLPSGTKWAKYNLGATSETEDGHYYMWGSVTPNDEDNCSWGTCPWGQNRPPMNTLDAEHDAAYQATSGKAHMPTLEQCNELIKNTTNEWVENYNGSGVNGRLFTASNGNSIFIPASGYRDGSSFVGQGNNAYVWSSSLYTIAYSFAVRFGFNSSTCTLSFYYRYYAQTIRPVK